ncbi:MAG: N-acetylglucosamine-6-phosphate deacetylase [Pirellulaceae bacterium]
MQIAGRRFDTGQAVVLEVRDGSIIAEHPGEPRRDLPWLAPGFVDLQVNGYCGQEFNDPDLTVEKIERVCLAMDADGVTSFCPTSTTHSFAMQSSTMRRLAEACDRSPSVARRVPGFHLEGPYISPIDGPRGAHPLEHCRPPDWDEFCRIQEAAGGRIRILTLSPEYEGSPRFIERAAESGVVVAIGHTNASSDQIRDAIRAGARMSTHLGNGAHGQIRRHPNYIWDQLAADELVASLIVDGHHLPPAVVKSFVRGKTPTRCVLVSDLVGMAGMPPGAYTNTSIGNIEILEGGRIVVAGQRQYLAGAGLPITWGIANIMRFAQVDLCTAIKMATQWAASLIGTESQLRVGAAANLVLFDVPETGPVHVRATINHGELVAGALSSVAVR